MGFHIAPLFQHLLLSFVPILLILVITYVADEPIINPPSDSVATVLLVTCYGAMYYVRNSPWTGSYEITYLLAYLAILLGCSYAAYWIIQESNKFRWVEFGVLPILLVSVYMIEPFLLELEPFLSEPSLSWRYPWIVSRICLPIMMFYPVKQYLNKKQGVIILTTASIFSIIVFYIRLPGVTFSPVTEPYNFALIHYIPAISFSLIVVPYIVYNSYIQEFSKMMTRWCLVVFSVFSGSMHLRAVMRNFLLPPSDPFLSYYVRNMVPVQWEIPGGVVSTTINKFGIEYCLLFPPLLVLTSVATTQLGFDRSPDRAGETRVDWPQPRYDESRTGSIVDSQWISPDDEPTWSVNSLHVQQLLVNNESLYVLSDTGNVSSVNLRSGDEEWVYDSTDTTNLRVTSAFEYMFILGDRSITALTAADGDIQWAAELESDLIGTPGIENMVLYYACTDGTVCARDAKTGDVEWSRTEESTVATGVAVAAGTLYLGRADGSLIACDSSTGERTWVTDIGETFSDTPVVANDIIYSWTDSGEICAVSAEDGEHKWAVETEANTTLGLAATDDAIYVTESDGIVKRITTDGEVAWRLSFDAPIRSEPIVVGPTLLIHDDAKVYGLEAASGDEDWTLTVGSTVTAVGPSAHRVHIGTTDGLQTFTGRGHQSVDPSGAELSKADSREPISSVDHTLKRASDAIDRAERAYSQNQFDAAVTEYETGINQYETVLNDLSSGDDRYDEVASRVENATQELESLQNQRTERTRLVEALTTAETHFQTAIGAPASDKVVVTRERYRQARNAYDEALDMLDEAGEGLLDVKIALSPQPTVAAPPESLSEFPGIHPGAEDVLAELDLDTLTKLRDAESETIETLLDNEAIGPRLGIRLAALNRWHAGDEVVFTSREDIERRREFAAEGYQVHQ